MKVYITKYALTKGIIEAKAEKTQFPNMIKIVSKNFRTFHKPFWHELKIDAIEHAECLRKRKIESLEKSISKLKNKSFANIITN